MTLRNILVPFDFSSCSQLALTTACELALRLQAELHLVNVQEGEIDSAIDRLTIEQLLAAVSPAFEIESKVHREVLHGNIHDELVKYAKLVQADLIVMGTRGRSAIWSLALGSVAQRLLRSAPCPVTLVTEAASEARTNVTLPDKTSVKQDGDQVSESAALDLITRALSLRATDIHIDPSGESQYAVRLRIDGKLHTYCSLDQSVSEHLINQYHSLARIDHADPFHPREGRLKLPSSMRDIEVRVTTSPVAGGQAVALRLFSKENVFRPLDQLGFSEHGASIVEKMLHGSEGLILVTGPTGAGKTTTVYSMLQSFAGQHRNIVSIEDPVEFAVPFVRQLSVDERHGVTMTNGLRTLLRMDPDVIFIGEIRDPENAGIALRAASSGRFVFSTLHTRDVASTITALRDLEVSNHSLSGNLVGVVNQRLLRKLCLQCRKAVPLPPEQQEFFLNQQLEIPHEIFEPVGCEACRGSGFHGRCGIFEVVSWDRGLTDAIAANASESEIRRQIRSQGTTSLTADSMNKVREGVTSLGEALSIRWLY